LDNHENLQVPTERTDDVQVPISSDIDHNDVVISQTNRLMPELVVQPTATTRSYRDVVNGMKE
jgi:hypothetical protein